MTVTPRYLLLSTTSKVCPCSMYVDWNFCLLPVLTLTTVHLLGLKLICHVLYCMLYRVLPLTYRRTPSSHKDRKGSFTTRPTGKVPGYKNVIKRAYYLQQPACWHNTSKAAVACLGGGENQRAWRKTTASLYGTGKPCRHN